MSDATAQFNALYAGRVAPAVGALEMRRILTFVAGGVGFLVVVNVGIQISVALQSVSFLAPIGLVFVFLGLAAGIAGPAWLFWRTNRDLPMLLSKAIAGGLGLTWQAGAAFSEAGSISVLGLAPPRGERAVRGVFSGTTGGQAFQIAEVQDTQGLGQSRFTTYQGFLMAIAYPQAFPATVALLRPGGGQPGMALQDVGLVDARFERHFEVFASDQIESRVLLDPTEIERLAQLDQEIGEGRLQCGFYGHGVYAAIKTVNLASGKDAWPNLMKPVNRAEWVRTLAWDLYWAARLAKELRPAEAWLR